MQQENLFDAAKKAFFSLDSYDSPLDAAAKSVPPGSIEEFLQRGKSNFAQAAQSKPVPFAQVPKQAKAEADLQADEHELATVGNKK
jgi:hypothetical protein